MSQVNVYAEFNAKKQVFWEAQGALMEKRMAPPAICGIAVRNTNAQMARHVPLPWQQPFEMALVDAEAAYKECNAHRSRPGGKAKKSDTLNNFILDAARKNPKISQNELFHALRREKESGKGFIHDIDAQKITFETRDGRR